MTEQRQNQKNANSEVRTFSVPFALNKIKENITINTNTPTKPSKEKLIKQALKFHSQGNISEAEKYYKSFINHGYKDHRVFSNYGAILKNLGKLKEAELSYRKAIALNPDFAQTHYNLGIILKDLGNLQEAEVSTRKAIEIKPDFANAHLNLGSLLKDLGKSEEAEVSTRKAIQLKPDFANAHLNLGTIFQELGNLKEAEVSTRKAIQLKPDFANAHLNLGNILSDLGKSQEAESSYSKSIELNPDFNISLMNRARLFFNQEKFDKALRDLDSCNTKESRSFSLEILYKLGRIEEIYQRIEKTYKLDDSNISMAAFSSFITAKENKKTEHNFCPNPLSFLYISNLRLHLKGYDKFIKNIINELGYINTIWEPPKKATHGGFQTPIHMNLFSNSTENISYLKSIIIKELDSYLLKFEKESCSYIQNWPSNKHLKAWHVILKKQGYQSAHIHPDGWLSGVIYLKVVPSRNKDEGAIEFSLNGVNYFDVNSPQLIHQPEEGDIVFFPSSLHHRTIPFSTDTDRIVIAFDLLPN
ncbi:tetratricopeptide repeat protein [Prochlorococcus sp. MIT 0916]|uniref:tetratricopeptide repeat protein n=1 Tax=Prochlorococcus sp. MIT 0916 TaxID=3082521 RepID=UPI0039B3E6A0